jgi:hypothetical protein
MKKLIGIVLGLFFIGTNTFAFAEDLNCENGLAMSVNSATKEVTYTCAAPRPIQISKPTYSQEVIDTPRNTQPYDPRSIEHYKTSFSTTPASETSTVISDTATVLSDTSTAMASLESVNSLESAIAYIRLLLNQIYAIFEKLGIKG